MTVFITNYHLTQPRLPNLYFNKLSAIVAVMFRG